MSLAEASAEASRDTERERKTRMDGWYLHTAVAAQDHVKGGGTLRFLPSLVALLVVFCVSVFCCLSVLVEKQRRFVVLQ